MKNSVKIVILLFSFMMTLSMAMSVSASESIQVDEYDILLSSLGLSDIDTTGVLSNSEITTTDGSPITTEEKHNTDFSDSLEEIYSWVQRYGIKRKIVEIAPPSNLYNSHSYAWYQADSDYDQYWIVSPSPFIGDEHHFDLSEDTATVGDIIVYCSGTEYLHSAVICDIEYENGEKVFICESKWESFGVYRHR